MIWICLALIIVGILIQEKTEHRKLGKFLWIFGLILLIVPIVLIIAWVIGIGTAVGIAAF